MTEHEYEEWFDENLGEIESLDKLCNVDSPFIYAPKPLKRKEWLIGCAGGFFACLIISFCTAYAYETTNCWVLSWFSNLLLNFSIGLVASLTIMIYTNIRDKNVAFYTDMLPVIEKRIEMLRKAYYSHSLKIQREYQSGNYQNSYEAWHVNSNTCFVILNYIRFLNTVLPPNFVEKLPNEKQLKTFETDLLAANRRIQKEFFADETFSKETCAECIKATDLGMYALNDLERFSVLISSNLYGLKYSKKDKKKFAEYNLE